MTRLATLADFVSWATIVATLVTAAGVIVAIVALYSQSKQAHFAASLDNLWRFDDQLHGKDMVRIRLTAAKALQNGQDVPEIVDILNFFEMLGLVFRKKGIDPEVALENFGWWVRGYWYACQGKITKDREGDPSVPGAKPDPSAWEEFERLKNALERLDREKKRKTSAGTTLTAQLEPLNVEDFLADECNLKP